MRIALGLEYNGSAFKGWQYQVHTATVQAAVEAAISKVVNHPIRVVCAGRTDTGVHATAQVIHFDTDVMRDDRAWIFGINANLPKTISVQWFKYVSDDFHARFSALARSYRYILLMRPMRPALLPRYVTWDYRQLNIEFMREALHSLIGQHDFSAFRGAGCQAKSPVREVQYATLTQAGEMMWLDIRANAFLYHMVRNIMGSLIVVGAGVQSPGWLAEVLASRQRERAAATAVPDGLYFTGVYYPEHFNLPNEPRYPHIA
ncbi:MAG: tRNA pseudouridine(38-40) synthase TruA [Gammaproteobacteria bacterium]|nr:tRNA pseudouridine(38-40) synthase TruA [Gammaproteobacteria bacterium]